MKKNSFKKILFITLTNIGDVILTTPVLTAINKNFPQAEITVIVSPEAANLFEENPRLRKVIIYKKFFTLSQKIKLLLTLRRQKFDIVIDLKNTLFGFLCGAKYKTSLLRKDYKELYKKDSFLNAIRPVIKKIFNTELDRNTPFYIWTCEEDKKQAEKLLKECGYCENTRLIAISPFAKSDTKTWPLKNFQDLINKIQSYFKIKVILIGSEKDRKCSEGLEAGVDKPVCNLCGLTSLRVLAEILKKCSCVIANDSAPMHLAAAVATPVIAIFGPTSVKKYAPREEMHRVLQAGFDCQPCEKAQCSFNKKPSPCLASISTEDVFEKIKEILKK